MIDNKKIPNLGNNQKLKPSTNIFKYFFIISLIILLIIATTLCLTLVKTGKISKSFNITQKENINNYTSSPVVIDSNNTDITVSSNDSVLIYNCTYNTDGTKETEKVIKYNIANNSIQKLQLDGYKIIDPMSYTGFNIKHIFLSKDNKIFVYDISTSKITKTSLPDLKEDKKYQDDISLISFSKDQNSVIFQINTYNKNDPGPEIGGGPPSLSNKEYIYTISENKTTISNILQKSKKLVQDNPGVIGWDSKENTLFVILYGNDQLFAKLDLNKNIVTKTNTKGFNYYSLSPSFKQVAVFDAIKDSISIYDTDNLNNVKKELNISQIKDKNDYNLTLLSHINWSPTENELALSFDQKIYTININSGQILLKYTDNTIGNGLLYWERNNITYSNTGKFLFITDWDNTNQDDIDKGQDIYRTIKIDRDTNTTEVVANTSSKDESSFIFGVTR